jgi:hypothetical protein
MERLLISGAFEDMVAAGGEAYVTCRGTTPNDASSAFAGKLPTRILAVDLAGCARELDVRPDGWLADLFVVGDELLWTESNHPMQAGWRRAIRAIDRRAHHAEARALVDEESMRAGIVGDGRGGALVSAGSYIGRVVAGSGPAAITTIVESVNEPPGGPEQVGLAAHMVGDGARAIWSTMHEPHRPSRLCCAPLEGGRAVELRASASGDLVVLGTLAGAVLFEGAGEGLFLLDPAGRARAIGSDLKRVGCIRSREARGVLWLHAGDGPESCVHVLAPGASRLEALPFEAKRFDVTSEGVFRLTSAGLYFTQWARS